MGLGEVWEKILDFFLIILIVACFFSVIGANNSAVTANNYLNSVGETISNSNLNTKTIDKMKDEAKNNGYELDVTLYNSEVYGSRYAELKLTYKYEIPILKVDTTHYKTKTIR